jgi:hypothetical protein
MLPDFVVSTAEVAVIYNVVKDSLGATVSIPLVLMFVPGVTAPVPVTLELTVHVTVDAGSYVPVTVARN